MLDPAFLVSTFGALGILAILFAETGLLVGFFLPGDSLLFTAGLLAAGPNAPLGLPWVVGGAAAGALLGAQAGFHLGRRAGVALRRRSPESRIGRAITRAEQLLTRYGYGRAVVLARFVPVVRTVMNPLAGAIGMPVRTFVVWQVAGGLLWTVGLVWAGYLLGGTIPGVDRYLLPLVAVVVVLSLVPMVIELARTLRRTG